MKQSKQVVNKLYNCRLPRRKKGRNFFFETRNPIHRRANQHRSDINAGHKNIPTVRHFKNCVVKYLKLTVIERVRNPNQDIRRARENYWIHRLKPTINSLV